MTTVRILIFSMLLVAFMATSSEAGWLIYHKPEFKGKVIDAETKEPIEGAVVVVVYNKHTLISGPGGGYTSVIKVKETLTDKNGEFYFSPYTTLIQPNSVEDTAEFIIYKPGYKSSAEFTVWALSEGLGFSTDKFSATLKKRVDDKWRQEFEDYLKTIPEKDRARTQRVDATKYIQIYWAIIPMKNAKEKLQSLDIPFFEIPDDIDIGRIKWEEKLGVYDLDEKSGYKVIGLPKAKTREERLRAMPGPVGEDSDYKEQKLFIQLLNEENKNLGLKGEYKIKE